MKKNTDVMDELNTEIENRIKQMESKDYEFPLRFSKMDYIVTAVVIAVCLAAVIAGGFIR